MIEDVADVEGAAPRWLVPATLRNPYDDAKNTTVTLLIIDTELEREAKLGRSWDFRQLGRTEAIAVSASLPCLALPCCALRARVRRALCLRKQSSSALSEIDVAPNNGEDAIIVLDWVSLIASLQGTDEVDVSGTLGDLIDLNLPPITVNAGPALRQFLESLGIDSACSRPARAVCVGPSHPQSAAACGAQPPAFRTTRTSFSSCFPTFCCRQR